MPYKSDAQRRFLHAKHPEIAAKWDAEIRAKKKGDKVEKSDPFEVSKAKIPKMNTGFDRAQKAGQYARKVGRKAANAGYNKISKPGHTRVKQSFLPYRKFGQEQVKREGTTMANVAVGGLAGTFGGALAGDARYGGQTRHDARLNHKVNKAFKVPKRPHLITDMGTGRPGLKPGVMLGAAAATGTLSYTGAKVQQKETRKELERTYRKQQKAKVSKAGTLERYNSTRSDRNKLRAKDAANVGAQTAVSTVGGISAVKFMSGHRARPGKKAFIAAGAAGAATAAGAFAGKWDKKQYRVKKNGSTTVAKQEKVSGGRLAAGYIAPGFHGAVAGKKGKKLRAAGRELGSTIGGGLAGGLAATALTRGKSPVASQLGASAGSIAGNLKGTSSTHNKGYYKPLKKNDTTSAFGVDHGY